MRISRPAGVVQNNTFDVKNSSSPVLSVDLPKLLGFPGNYTVVAIDTGVTVTLVFVPRFGYLMIPQKWSMTTDTVTVRVGI